MSIIRVNNLGRKFHKFIDEDEPFNDQFVSSKKGYVERGDFWALRNVYMNINEGEIVGIIGRNGSGKSTLLSVIAGVLSPNEGEVVTNGKVSALLALGAGFQDELTGRENVYLNGSLLGFTKQEIEGRFANIVDFSELGDFINAPLGSYSAGMKMRLGFSVAIHEEFSVLVTDEVIAVGDIYFQKKCFEKMEEFRKQGKAMLIATQDMNLIERFCDHVFLLENGRVIFEGIPQEGVEQYRMLLNKKKVLSESSRLDMVRKTKRWATDTLEWGKTEGTKEVKIKSVTLLNKRRREINKIRPGEKLIVRVNFTVHKEIDSFHFGSAIFREDGVYCYGPNTQFDGLPIKAMGKGEGYFELEYKEFSFMPGIYYFSAVVWDKQETFAYDYHRCGCKIEVTGDSFFGQLLCLSSKWVSTLVPQYFLFFDRKYFPKLDYLVDEWGTQIESDMGVLVSIKCLNNYGSEDNVFVTGKEMKIKVDWEAIRPLKQQCALWVGIYRSDGIYCHGNIKKSIFNKGRKAEILIYPQLMLLPGGYRISFGIWDPKADKFIFYSHGIYSFNMISQKRDHGTIYLDHYWRWKIPEKEEVYAK